MFEYNDETVFILGRPNFWCGSVAQRLRQLGHQIEKKAEAEQAYIIYWMLGLYEQFGKKWRDEFGNQLSVKVESDKNSQIEIQLKNVTR